MPDPLRLPAFGVALVALVLAVQVAAGGGDFAPLRPADPCAPREVRSQADGLDALTERLVLRGVDGAACRLHLSREAYVLRLAGSAAPSDGDVDALHRGLLDAVRRMKADGSLPPASALVDDALDQSDLNGFVKAAVRALPDAAIDAVLKTDDVLVRTVDGLDLRALLRDLDSEDELDRQIRTAVEQAVRDSLLDRVLRTSGAG